MMRLAAVLILVLVAVEARPNRTPKEYKKSGEWKALLRPVSESDSLVKKEWEDIQPKKTYDKVYDPCDDLKCGNGKLCFVLEDDTATCMSRRAIERRYKLHEKKYDEESCQRCPDTESYHVCGTDGKTYHDVCHLERKACKTGKKIAWMCDGPCPCTPLDEEIQPGFYNDYVQEPKKLVKETLIQSDELPAGNAVDLPELEQTAYDVADEQAWVPSECTDSELSELPRRLMEWFRLLQAEEEDLYKKHPHKEMPVPDVEVLPKCKESTAWMFNTLDVDRDLVLSSKEYYDMYNDEYEVCMRTFLDECDQNRDWKITGDEWCNCFHAEEAVRPPCFQAMDDVPTMMVLGEIRPLAGAFVPTCDENGYYSTAQCHGGTGFCWCVDQYGVEYENTRVRGEPPCGECS
ncbi:testican-1-like [Saccoglossus kowalevskii]|uniref:Testican-1-like n=1 Tax=Saccoglossus kowalevskii TaxID=10224 RepID=A0ABM0GN42_SACKO|nr:PREDICTED: testican-1-like [Saccoglossus kowalevskii]